MARTTPHRRIATSPAEVIPAIQPSREELGRYLARELHDSVAQTLAEMLLELQSFRIDQHGRAGALQRIDLLEDSTRTALADLRALLVELRGQGKEEQEDLVRLVRGAMLERQQRHRLIEFTLHVAPTWPAQLPAGPARELFLIVSESMDNAIRHAGAKRLGVAMAISDEGQAVLTITDDGRGMNRTKTNRTRFGILGMRERAALLGGQVELAQQPEGTGTVVQVTVPLDALAAPPIEP